MAGRCCVQSGLVLFCCKFAVKLLCRATIDVVFPFTVSYGYNTIYMIPTKLSLYNMGDIYVDIYVGLIYVDIYVGL